MTDVAKRLAVVIEKHLSPDPDVIIRHTVLEGHPTAVLVEDSKRADFLVVGSRRHGAFAGIMIGSVSEGCVTHSACPIVVAHHRVRPLDRVTE